MSPTGWKYKNCHTLWIPQDRIDEDIIQSFKNWCEEANNHIWLKLNKNIENYFKGNELLFCTAYDWNMNLVLNCRTKMGEAEYRLKYNHYKNQEETINYYNIIFKGILEIAKSVFIKKNTLITTIPAIKDKQDKLSYQMTEYLSNELNMAQLIFTLDNDKSQTKCLSVEQKIKMWESIYSNGNFNISNNFYGNDIIIVDDLYQSGTSMWAMAKYLQDKGANSVRGLVAVKSMKDSDNV